MLQDQDRCREAGCCRIRTGAGKHHRKRTPDGPALDYFAPVTAPDHWPVRSDFIDRFILAVFPRSDAIKPPNRLLLLGYFLKTRHFAGGRPV
jgi:hypothetical protein